MARETTGKRHEYFGAAILILTLLLFVSLISYSPRDSSFNVLSYKTGADNRIGPIGAHISDLLFQTFGWSIFLLLIPLAVIGWKLIRGREIYSPYVRTLGLLLLMCATCTTLQLFPVRRLDVNFAPGGATGVLLTNLLLPNLNRTGTLIVVAGAFLLGILAASTFSLEHALRRVFGERDSERIGLWQRFRDWRARRKPPRTFVSIKAPSAPAGDSAIRSGPAKLGFASQSGELRTAAPTASSPPETARSAPMDRFSDRKFTFPPIELLSPPATSIGADEAELMERARLLAEKFAEFDVRGSITQIHPGPVVTTFEFKPDPGIKYSKMTSLVDDLCLGIKAESIRIDRIPGKATVGIEVPNPQRETIMLREVIESEHFRKSSSKLLIALGKLIDGSVYVTDLNRMPHLLIAGATGSGKSVGLNCMITSILYRATPDEVKFILMDPKRLELGIYVDIPHLLVPIVTDTKEAATALRWATSEMESRYKKLAVRGVRNTDQYNALLRATGRQLSFLDSNEADGELEKPLPYLVLVIDELADLMIASGREVEESITRLAAMARAVGIHLIIATQRPSVDVITGIIKANFPCRIAFKVASKVDSRTIIDSNGAEQLLGNGDMLFMPPGSSRLTRIHGAYVSERETQLIVEHLRKQARPSYDESVLSYSEEELDETGNQLEPGMQDPLYKNAVRIAVTNRKASTSLLQRELSIGYGRAARLIDLMYKNNLVGPPDGSKAREVLVGMDYLDQLK